MQLRGGGTHSPLLLDRLRLAAPRCPTIQPLSPARGAHLLVPPVQSEDLRL